MDQDKARAAKNLIDNPDFNLLIHSAVVDYTSRLSSITESGNETYIAVAAAKLSALASFREDVEAMAAEYDDTPIDTGVYDE